MKALTRGLLMAFVLGVLIVNVSWGAMGGSATNAIYKEAGTVTIKTTITGDSATSIGSDHHAADAVKSPWFLVPAGVDFVAYVEVRDTDSAKAFGPDTVHVALETAPIHGLAYDSSGSYYKYPKADYMWEYSALTWSTFTQQILFRTVREDTLNDTIAVAAASLKSGTANKQTTPTMNLGALRWSLCLDDADTLTDSGVRFNCYVVYRDPQWPTIRGDIETENMIYGSATPPVNKEATFGAGDPLLDWSVPYAVRSYLSPADKPKTPERMLR